LGLFLEFGSRADSGSPPVSVPSVLPKEFGLNAHVDYDLQFDKAFLDPLKIILNVINWQPEKISTLEEWFT
jgi:hypothetical protein